MGFSMGTHFCGGVAVKSELMIGHEHLDCGMGMMDQQPNSEQTSIKRQKCCDNQYLTLEVDHNFKKGISPNVEQMLVVVTVAKVLLEITPRASIDKIPVPNTSPPLPIQDYQSQLQVFII